MRLSLTTAANTRGSKTLAILGQHLANAIYLVKDATDKITVEDYYSPYPHIMNTGITRLWVKCRSAGMQDLQVRQ